MSASGQEEQGHYVPPPHRQKYPYSFVAKEDYGISPPVQRRQTAYTRTTSASAQRGQRSIRSPPAPTANVNLAPRHPPGLDKSPLTAATNTARASSNMMRPTTSSSAYSSASSSTVSTTTTTTRAPYSSNAASYGLEGTSSYPVDAMATSTTTTTTNTTTNTATFIHQPHDAALHGGLATTQSVQYLPPSRGLSTNREVNSNGGNVTNDRSAYSVYPIKPALGSLNPPNTVDSVHADSRCQPAIENVVDAVDTMNTMHSEHSHRLHDVEGLQSPLSTISTLPTPSSPGHPERVPMDDALNKLDFITHRDLEHFQSVRRSTRSSSRSQGRQRVLHRHFEPLENVNKALLTAQRVVDGFTRRQLADALSTLSTLCLMYYDESTWWEIGSAQLDEMRAAPNGVPFFNEWTPCNRWQIRYCLTMWPNGREPACEGFVKYGIEFDTLPDSVLSVVAMLQLTMFGRTRHGEWVEVRSLKRPNVFTDEFGSIGNYRYSLRRDALAEFTALRVRAFVDVMDVEFNEEHHDESSTYHLGDGGSDSERTEERMERIEFIPTPIRMERHRQFEWSIENEVLSAMKNEVAQRSVGRIFLSPTFGVGGNWALYGRFNANDGVDFGLRLLRLPVPNRIRSVDVDYWLEFSSGATGYRKKVEFSSLKDVMSYEHFNLCFRQNTFSVVSFNACCNLSVYVTIDILRVTDIDHNDIPRAQWEQYGVV